jgi:hypothetical protein
MQLCIRLPNLLILLMVYLTVLSVAQNIALNDKIINEQWIGKDMEGSGMA